MKKIKLKLSILISFLILFFIPVSLVNAKEDISLFTDESSLFDDLTSLNINHSDYKGFKYDVNNSKYLNKPFIIASAPVNNAFEDLYFYIYIPDGKFMCMNPEALGDRRYFSFNFSYKNNDNIEVNVPVSYDNNNWIDSNTEHEESDIDYLIKYKVHLGESNLNSMEISVGDVSYSYCDDDKIYNEIYDSPFACSLQLVSNEDSNNDTKIINKGFTFKETTSLLISDDIVFNVILDGDVDSVESWWTKYFTNYNYPQLWFYNFNSPISIDRILACDIEYLQTDYSSVSGMGSGVNLIGVNEHYEVKHIEPDVFKYSWFSENYEFDFFKTPSSSRLTDSDEFGTYCDYIDPKYFNDYQHSILFNVTESRNAVNDYVRSGNDISTFLDNYHLEVNSDYISTAPYFSICNKVSLSTLTYECDGKIYTASQIIDVDGPDDNQATLINPAPLNNPFAKLGNGVNQFMKVVYLLVGAVIALIVIKILFVLLKFIKSVILPKRRR